MNCPQSQGVLHLHRLPYRLLLHIDPSPCMAAETNTFAWTSASHVQWTCSLAKEYEHLACFFQELIELLVLFRVNIEYSRDKHDYLTAGFLPIELRFCLMNLWRSYCALVPPSELRALEGPIAVQEVIKGFYHRVYDVSYHPIKEKEYWKLQVSRDEYQTHTS